jgi:hypothetical protein
LKNIFTSLLRIHSSFFTYFFTYFSNISNPWTTKSSILKFGWTEAIEFWRIWVKFTDFVNPHGDSPDVESVLSHGLHRRSPCFSPPVSFFSSAAGLGVSANLATTAPFWSSSYSSTSSRQHGHGGDCESCSHELVFIARSRTQPPPVLTVRCLPFFISLCSFFLRGCSALLLALCPQIWAARERELISSLVLPLPLIWALWVA